MTQCHIGVTVAMGGVQEIEMPGQRGLCLLAHNRLHLRIVARDKRGVEKRSHLGMNGVGQKEQPAQKRAALRVRQVR